MSSQVGVLDIGVFLPEEIRPNAWWTEEVVTEWQRVRAAAGHPVPEVTSESGVRILRAMAEQGQDPFQGAVERRVLTPEMTPSDMEVGAARDAIGRAGVDAQEIDLVLTNSVTPDQQLSNPAAVLHQRLGLATECFAIQTEAAAYSFLAQLALAESMISSGRARVALLVQSSAASRLVEPHDIVSPYFGDGATAVVVGRVATRGVIGSVHFTDGRYPNTIVAGVPGGTWYGDGRAVIHVGDPAGLRSVLLQTVDLCTRSVEAVLEKSRMSASEVDFFCIHQGTPWLRSLAQEYAGLHAAASIDTFSKTGYLFSAIIPFGLRMARDQGLLDDGDVVLMFGGGTGMTYGATILEWGR